MPFSKNMLRDLYRKRARFYDFSANLYYLIGFREASYRKKAISRLNLAAGNTVVEVGCGTGLNFQYIRNRIGDTGKLIGIDLTDAMLEQAASRVEEKGWKNIQLLQCDAAEYQFPENLNAVFSSFALTLVPEYEIVIERISSSLVSRGRFVLLDLKIPDKWPMWMIKLAVLITRPFGVTFDLSDRKPWEVMSRYFRTVTVSDLYGGFAYITVAEK